VTVAVFTGFNSVSPIQFTPSNDRKVITYELYIALAGADFFMMVFALFGLYGNERTDNFKGRCYLLPWVVLLPFYVIYESGINIYYFYNQLNNQYSAPLNGGSPLGFVLVPLVYWAVKEILLFIGFIFIVIRVHYMAPNRIVQYVQHPSVLPPAACTDVYTGPAMHSPMPVTAPVSHSFALTPSEGRMSSPVPQQPIYGYGSPVNSGVTKSGWTTSVYNAGR